MPMGERVYVSETPMGGVYLENLDVERVCDRIFYSESVSSPLMVGEENGYYGVKPERLDEQWEKYRAVLKRLTIMSDAFMRNVLKKKECTECLEKEKENRVASSKGNARQY